MNFIIEKLEDKTYLTYPLSEQTDIDPLLIGMLQNNRIPGFAAFCVNTEKDAQQLCYDIHGLRSMKDIFAEVVSRHTLLNTFDAILAALDAAQDYMIDASSVVFDPEYIYFDPNTFRTALICLPFVCNLSGNDEKSFFKSIMFGSIFDPNEPCDHVARIMNYLNASAFDSAEFRSLLGELGAGENAEAPVTESEPFFDFPVLDAHSEKTALQEADDLLSAALSAPEPVEAPASDPLSLADQLLSEALAEAPAAQKEEPSDDPFAFLDAFAASEPTEKAAEEEPVPDLFADWFAPKEEKKVEEEPVPDPFADWFAPKEEKKAEVTEDSFDDFTTPIVSSRKKAAPAKPAESVPEAEALSFDFPLAEEKPATLTDAMKIADELLSATLAAAPTVQKEAPEAPAASGKEAAAESLDSFAAVPAKKSAARLEAEAILDALDLSTPAAEEEKAPTEAPTLSAKPLIVQEEPRSEPAHKGGFFSKLRKKEEAAKAPTPPVIPYFGTDGETTLLNVAQQSAKPSVPYLLRSSNQETVLLSKPIFRVGKDRDFADYCISDNSAISRRHANFLLRNGDVFIVDTNSTNHTFVNGVMIRSNTEIKLTHGDEIRLANEDFMLYCAGSIT